MKNWKVKSCRLKTELHNGRFGKADIPDLCPFVLPGRSQSADLPKSGEIIDIRVGGLYPASTAADLQQSISASGAALGARAYSEQNYQVGLGIMFAIAIAGLPGAMTMRETTCRHITILQA
ncbi:MAG: hypothetical protein WCE58_02610 [Gallionella sp.]